MDNLLFYLRKAQLNKHLSFKTFFSSWFMLRNNCAYI